jgi:hypothetical protein
MQNVTGSNSLINVACCRQGRRKLLKVGEGACFEGHFPNKKGHLKIFSRKSCRRGEGQRGEVSNPEISFFEVPKKFSGHTKKNFPGDIIFFNKYQKNFPHISYFFRKLKKFSGK